MTFPRHFDCTYVNTQKYEFRTISGRSTISGRRAIGAPGAPIVRNGRPRTISFIFVGFRIRLFFSNPFVFYAPRGANYAEFGMYSHTHHKIRAPLVNKVGVSQLHFS